MTLINEFFTILFFAEREAWIYVFNLIMIEREQAGVLLGYTLFGGQGGILCI